MSTATEPSLNEIGTVIDLAHALMKTEWANTAIEEPISSTEKAAVYKARSWLEALQNLTPEDEVKLARAVLEKHGLTANGGTEVTMEGEAAGSELSTMLTISAAHLTPEVADGLNNGKTFGTILFDKGDHGWFLYTHSDACDEPLIADLLSYAVNLGASWLCIDVDGPLVETLTDYSDLWE